MASGQRWNELLRQARAAARLSRRKLAALSGVSEETIYSYEAGRRHPKHETLLTLTRALKLDGAGTNAILQDAGFEPEPSAWLRQNTVAARPLAELPEELARYTWPCLAVNERFEIIAWNAPAIRVAELDFGRELPALHQRNLLRLGAMRHFRERVVNWHELVGMLVGMYKNYHMGNEELGEGSPYFQAVVADILARGAGLRERHASLPADRVGRPGTGPGRSLHEHGGRAAVESGHPSVLRPVRLGWQTGEGRPGRLPAQTAPHPQCDGASADPLAAGARLRVAR